MKGKFDFKDLMVQRGEMFVVGAVMLLVGYFVFDAFGHNVLKPGREPEDLKRDIETAKGVIEEADPPEGTTSVPILTNDPFAPSDLRVPKINKAQSNRGQPTFFSVEGPRACAGVGSFAYKAAAGAAKDPPGVTFIELGAGSVLPGYQANAKDAARAKRWVVIRYLVSVAKQQADFDKHFKGNVQPDKHDPNNDLVVFDLKPPIIERAEVTAQAGAALNWAALSDDVVKQGFIRDEDWVQARGGGKAQAGDKLVIDAGAISPVFTSPLPPLLMTDWTEQCVLHPLIPMLEGEKADNGQAKKVEQDKPGGGFGRKPDKKVVKAPKNAVKAAKTVEFHLFRFFDYTVQPGKTYVYRVKLYIGNPNFGIDPRFLAPEVAAVKQEEGNFSDDWSPTTKPVTVPIASGVFAGSLKRRAAGDSARMTVIDRNPTTGLEGHKEMTRRIGHLAYFPIEFDVKNKDAWYEDPDEPGVPKPRKKKGYVIVGKVRVLDPLRRKIRVDPTFISGVVLLDIRGGSDGQPDEILVMDARGNLSAHHSGVDAGDIERRNALVRGAKEPAETQRTPEED